MTRPKTEMNEREFWELAIRRVVSIMRGRATLAQLDCWLRSLMVNGQPLYPGRCNALVVGAKFIMYAFRAERRASNAKSKGG